MYEPKLTFTELSIQLHVTHRLQHYFEILNTLFSLIRANHCVIDEHSDNLI